MNSHYFKIKTIHFNYFFDLYYDQIIEVALIFKFSMINIYFHLND